MVRRAREAELSIFQPKRLHSSESLDAFRKLDIDLAVTCAFGRILRPSLLELPREGCINVHASLLPRHRGASPIPHTILAGDPWTGITIFRLDEGMDTGPILLQRLMPVAPATTCGTLSDDLAELGGVALAEALSQIRGGKTRYLPQPEEGATYAPRLEKGDGRCNWAQPADRIERFIRAMTPWPGARSVFHRQPIRIAAVEPVDLLPQESEPGTVISLSPSPILAALPGSIRLTRVQPPGKKEMEASAWARGARLDVGMRFE